MNSRRRFLALSSTAAFSLSCRPSAAQSVAIVRVGMSLTDGITPVLYGIRTGAFKDAGLDVQLVVGNNGAAQLAGLLGGSLDVAAASLMSLLSGHLRGVPLQLIAGSTLFNPSAPVSGVLVLKPSRITSFAELAGTVVVPTLRSLDQLGIQALADQTSGSSRPLKFVETTHSVMISALENGTADAAAFTEPTLTIAMEHGNVRNIGDPEFGIAPKGFMIAGFCSTPTLIARNPDVVSRFTRVLYRVTGFTNTHHDATVAMIAEYTGMTPDLVRKMTRQTIATNLSAGMIQPAIDIAAKYGYLDRGFDAKELGA
jgi:NitT/TauT family transport system substrate-binding protein